MADIIEFLSMRESAQNAPDGDPGAEQGPAHVAPEIDPMVALVSLVEKMAGIMQGLGQAVVALEQHAARNTGDLAKLADACARLAALHRP